MVDLEVQINMNIGNVKIKNRLVLAPLAGYTNTVYRKICHDLGAGLTYTEMISDKGLLYDNDKTWDLCFIDPNEHPTSLQLFGGNIEEITKAAILIDKKTNCDIIDINMGCPVKKDLKELKRNFVNYIEKMVRSIVDNVSKPVTCKIRLGWDHKTINHIEIAKACERGGASAICVHGRTKSDFYSGKVNLEAIKEVKENVNIPVIGNGDVKSIEDLENMLATGVDFVMIGRYFARFDESPSRKVKRNGTFMKEYWGEGSNRARNWQRYDMGGEAKNKLTFEEGVDSYIPYAGPLKDNVEVTVSKIKSTMCNCGSISIPEFHQKARLTMVSNVSIKEGGAHDVILKEYEAGN